MKFKLNPLRRIKKTARDRKFQKESFDARMQMETAAQKEIDARITRLELAFRNKTRTR